MVSPMPRAVILTALPVEYLAVRACLTGEPQEEMHPEGTIYERGAFVTANGQTWDIGLVEIGAGNSGAALEAERAIAHFNPDVALFVGVAGGIKDVKLGDVVASTKVYGYESGKSESGFKPRFEIGLSAYALEQRARAIAREWFYKAQSANNASHPNALVAPIAAGEKVVASTQSDIFNFLKSNYGDVVAVEMEGFGFLEAARANQRVAAIVIRGISDLIDGKAEADRSGSQRIAAQNASRFAFEMLSKYLVQTPSTPPIKSPIAVEPPRNSSSFENFQEDLGDGIKLEMVAIAGKQFLMGSPGTEAERMDSELPQHRVGIESFYMGKYTVTQEQWWVVATKLPKVKRDLNSDPSKFKGDRRPVEWVSWYEAVEFCDRLSQKTGKRYRLPSEAEWEYACRAGTTTNYYFGDEITPELVNFGIKYGGTTEVGKFQPNAFGLCDTHGNVWEWCADHWYRNYEGAPTDGSAWLTSKQEAARVSRGGSWDNVPERCRSACRDDNDPGFSFDNLGFRVVCGLA